MFLQSKNKEHCVLCAACFIWGATTKHISFLMILFLLLARAYHLTCGAFLKYIAERRLIRSGISDTPELIFNFFAMTKQNEVTSHPVAPDGGWGWVVCGATFVCLAVNEGLALIFGLLYIDLLDYYREDPGMTAAVGSTYLGAHMIVG